MRVYVTNGPRNGLNMYRNVDPCPGIRIWWVLGSVHATYQAVDAANTYRPRFQVRTRPAYPFFRRRAGRPVQLIDGSNRSSLYFTCVSCLFRFFVYLSYHTTRTTTAERRADQLCRHRGASSGQIFIVYASLLFSQAPCWATCSRRSEDRIVLLFLSRVCLVHTICLI